MVAAQLTEDTFPRAYEQAAGDSLEVRRGISCLSDTTTTTLYCIIATDYGSSSVDAEGKTRLPIHDDVTGSRQILVLLVVSIQISTLLACDLTADSDRNDLRVKTDL